jgi:hypothetical protein
LLLLHAFLLFSQLLLPLLLVALLLITVLLLPFLLFPLLLIALLLLPLLLFPLLLIALLLLTFLLFPLLLLLLLIGLPKHHLRRNRDQGKAKQKDGCLFGFSKCGCNYREKNELMRHTFRHSCRLGVDGVAFEKVSGRLCGKRRLRHLVG